MINAALVLHSACVKSFRKTAKNFHYEFNLRHLSNVFQGLLVANPDKFTDASKFVQLWLHESERVYGDLLVSKLDLMKYKQEAQIQAKRRFPAYNMAKFFAAENADPLVFCNFVDGYGDETMMYDQVLDLESITETFKTALVEYNEENAAMNLVLFGDAVEAYLPNFTDHLESVRARTISGCWWKWKAKPFAISSFRVFLFFKANYNNCIIHC